MCLGLGLAGSGPGLCLINLLSELSAALDNINPPRVKTTGDKDALNTEIHILLALVTDKIQRKYPPVTQLVDF